MRIKLASARSFPAAPRRVVRALTAGLLFSACSHSITGGQPLLLPEPFSVPSLRTEGGTFRVIHAFGAAEQDGNEPLSTLTAVNGTLYGTTVGGGTSNFGTVYRVSPAGSTRVLYSFTGYLDGEYPWAELLNVDDVLYGTTTGTYGKGTVFSVTTQGSEKTLYDFKGGSDGFGPFGGLVELNGKLYGTTGNGGKHGNGTIFSLTFQGVHRVLYSLDAATSGAQPSSSMIVARGALYGTTAYGGKFTGGTLFRLKPDGTFQVVHSFGRPGDGLGPSAKLLNVGDALYGTTAGGGRSGGFGTVFSMLFDGKEHIIHTFGGEATDGLAPTSSLLEVNGWIYGTTRGYAGSSGYPGTIFRVTPGGRFKTVHYFAGGRGGSYPQSGLAFLNGVLFGTTTLGGRYGDGIVYKVAP